MKKRTKKSLLGSKRSRYFQEPLSGQAVKFRPQRVRFRKRYATSVLEKWGQRLGAAAQTVLLVGVVGTAGFYGHRFWTTSELLKIKSISYSSPPPKGLDQVLDIKSDQNILTLPVSRMEKTALARFKELQDLSIQRSLDQSVTVVFHYRSPFALLESQGSFLGVDEKGVLFPLNDDRDPSGDVPQIFGMTAGSALTETVQALVVIASEQPAFSSLVKFIKTDRIQSLHVVLRNDVIVYWGPMDPSTAADRAVRILKVLEKFKPKAPQATLRFVTDDRVVMDSKWELIK